MLHVLGRGRNIPHRQETDAARQNHDQKSGSDENDLSHVLQLSCNIANQRPTGSVRLPVMLGLVHGEFATLYRRRAHRFQDKSGAFFPPEQIPAVKEAPPYALPRTIALVGLMGAGKTSVGRRLAQRLHVPFVDADTEIEIAAGATIEEIFERHGEAAFREGERRVIARLLEAAPQVLATGGGAYMDAATRALMRERAITIWLRAEIDLLLARVMRRNNRPLLKVGDPRAVLERLIAERYPVYAEADLMVETLEGPLEATLDCIMAGLAPLIGVPAEAT